MGCCTCNLANKFAIVNLTVAIQLTEGSSPEMKLHIVKQIYWRASCSPLDRMRRRSSQLGGSGLFRRVSNISGNHGKTVCREWIVFFGALHTSPILSKA